MIRSWLDQIINVCFPNLCVGCDVVLLDGDPELCVNCLGKLPPGEAFPQGLYGIGAKFWGHFPVGHASALYDLAALDIGKKIIHAIKYSYRPQVAHFLGGYYGKNLEPAHEKWQWEVIIPIPLHRDREIERGYNQSLYLAEGLAEALQIPAEGKWLMRHSYTATQTRKSRAERFKSLNDVFSLDQKASVAGKKILLVDDVITTGSTIVHAARPLLQGGSSTISVAALGSRVNT